jgi:tryptophanyl-tRNA synthetase
MYPVLMGADILMFNAHKVPVGRDQVQHIEMARDMASSFNHRYGEHFVLPEADIEDQVATLLGLDGRKMSKSYNNTIPLFASRGQLQKLVNSIVTDSRAPGQAKDPQTSTLFQIFQAFASPAESHALRQQYAQGIAWGEAKQVVFERLDQEISPMRATYQALMAEPAKIEDILLAGATKARRMAQPLMHRLRHAVGLRNLASSLNLGPSQTGKTAQPTFKQYRQADGQFYFKLLDAQGQLLLQSLGFESPQQIGRVMAQLQNQGGAALPQLTAHLQALTPAQLEIAQAALQTLAANAAKS